MKHNDNITILREYKNLYDTKTLLKKIIHTEFETLSAKNNDSQKINLYNDAKQIK